MILHITVKPNSKTDEVQFSENGEVKIKLKASPVEGKANAYLLKFLSKKLGISKSKMNLLKGHNNPHKKLEIEMDERDVLKKLGSRGFD